MSGAGTPRRTRLPTLYEALSIEVTTCRLCNQMVVFENLFWPPPDIKMSLLMDHMAEHEHN